MVDFGIEVVQLLKHNVRNSVSQNGPIEVDRYGDYLAKRIARRYDHLTKRLDSAVEASSEMVGVSAQYDEQVGRLGVAWVCTRGKRVQKHSFCERAAGQETGVVVRRRIASERARRQFDVGQDRKSTRLNSSH